MSDFTKLSHDTAEGMLQTLIDAKNRAGGIAAIIEGLEPLVEKEETAKKLQEAKEAALMIRQTFYDIYRRHARELLTQRHEPPKMNPA